MSRWTAPLAALVGVLLGVVGVLWYQSGGTGRDPGRARIEAIVHDYVLAHPEIIPQAMQGMQDRETGKIVADNRAAIETPFGSAWAGNAKGDVTLVEYYDYNCGFCRASLPTVAELIRSDPNLRVVYRELPVLAPTSRDAARASLVAAAQGRFQRFHDALYAAGPVTTDTIAAAARSAGVDLSRAAALGTQIDDQIRANMTLAARLGMTGTPSWVIGNRIVSGAQPLEELQKAVAAARAAR